MRRPPQLLATSALLVGCNAILGIGSDYHRAANGGGASAGDGGASASGGAGSGAKAGSAGNAGSGNNAGSNATGGADGGTSGSTSGRGGSAGSSTSSGGDSGNPGGDGGEVGDVGGGSGQSGSGGKGGGSGAKGGNGGTGGNGATGGSAGAGGGGITVQLDQTHQTIQGFGINTYSMPIGKALPIDDLFDTSGANAIGLSILRVGMNPDGTLNGRYAAEARDKGAKIIGGVWSPPASCKSNNSTQQGGSLKSSCYDSWSTTLANFAKSQALYAMSLGSAVDFASCKAEGPPCTDDFDSTTFTAKEMVDWVKIAGVKLHSTAPSVKVIAPEPQEWIHAWSNASATGSTAAGHPNSSDPLGCGCFSNTPTETGCAQKCLDGNGYDYGHWLWNDTDAWSAFDIFGVQELDAQIAYRWPSDVNGGVRNKEVWQTEMAGIRYWPEEGPSTDIHNGLAVAGWIHSALTVGEASAWLYFWYEAYFQDDNEGLALTQGSSTIAKRYYALGQYSRFVRPGYVAVEVTGNDSADVLLSAYKSADSLTTVIVAINRNDGAASPVIGFAGGTVPAQCTPTVTSGSDNLQNGVAVAVTGDALSASLAGKTITTYVCN